MRTIAFVNRKGGVGKTRSAVETAYILACGYQQRVLLVDVDAQGDATYTILGRRGGDGVASLMSGLVNCYQEVVERTDIPNLDIIPGSSELDQLDLHYMISSDRPSFHTLRDLCEAVTEDDAYDVIVIDCPTYYSSACINAIAAADAIVIPVTTDAFASTNMHELVQQIDNVRKICPGVRVAGCLVTRFCNDEQDQDALAYLKEDGPVPVFRTVIRESTKKVKQASWGGQTAQEWSPFCNSSRDYRAFVAELVGKEGLIRGEV